MKPKTFIFIGRSGCGKGTQIELLEEYIRNNDEEERNILRVETGKRFREFTKGEKYSNKLAADIAKDAGLQPDFLAVNFWSNFLINEYNGEQHLFIDGTPRSVLEAKTWTTAIKFYKIENPVVIYLDVSHGWAEDRLEGRGRTDDIKKEHIERRLNWFDTDVLPTIEYFMINPLYKFFRINGQQPVEEVHQAIIEKISL
ncbi:MAG: nucleoside monophosphate kinase [Candidatus Paceibacterota bacterium]|jgi:adenylate kinase family enzyme